MSATVLYMSISLDGFIAGPNQGPDTASVTAGTACMSGSWWMATPTTRESDVRRGSTARSSMR